MFKYEFAIDQQEDEDLRCPICNYYFSNDNKPYLLICNHNLCLKCIDAITEKKMYHCPICRKEFTVEDKKNFQVNFAFLNLVIKILKSKVIYCKKCNKIFNWIDHFKVCEQNYFKETNEINEEIKKLSDQCYMIIRYIDKHKNILSKSKTSIYSDMKEIINSINTKFTDNFRKSIESFFDNIPIHNFENQLKDIISFLEISKPFNSKIQNVNLIDLGKTFHLQSKSFDLSLETDSPIRKRSAEVGKINFSSNYLTRSKPNMRQSNPTIAEFDEDSCENLSISNIDENNEKNKPMMMKRNQNSIVNLNYNFNITDLIESHDNVTNKKQMIIVRNEKVEVINNSEYRRNDNILSTKIKTPKSKRENIINLNNSVNIRSKLKETFKNMDFSSRKETNQKNEDNYENINIVISKYNKTKEIVQKILTYTQQIEFTTKSIRSQISSNHNLLNNNITQNLSGLYDNITVSFTNYPRRYLINCFEGTKKIWIFDVRKKTSDIKEFDVLKHKLTFYTSIEYDDSDLIFISGGKIPSGLFSNDIQEGLSSNLFTILRWSNKKIEHMGQMPRKRSNHSTLYFNNKLYVIGGALNESTKIKECECYNLIDKRWELLPSLNSPRSSASLCVYNNQYLYIFRGSGTNGLCLDTIEFLNINNISHGWSLFKPDDPGMCWSSAANGISVVIGESKVLICGGVNGQMLDFCYLFDPIRKSVYRGFDLIKPAIFNSSGTIFENNVYLIDYKNETGKNFGIHIYEVFNNVWRFNH